MFDHIMQLKKVEQSTSEKNVDLETQVAKLNCDVVKLHFQLRLRVFKLEKEVIQLKKEITEGKNTTKLENKKLKETIKLVKTLHKDQLRLKDARISDQNL